MNSSNPVETSVQSPTWNSGPFHACGFTIRETCSRDQRHRPARALTPILSVLGGARGRSSLQAVRPANAKTSSVQSYRALHHPRFRASRRMRPSAAIPIPFPRPRRAEMAQPRRPKRAPPGYPRTQQARWRNRLALLSGRRALRHSLSPRSARGARCRPARHRDPGWSGGQRPASGPAECSRVSRESE